MVFVLQKALAFLKFFFGIILGYVVDSVSRILLI